MALVWCDGFEGYGNTNNTTPAPTGVLADKYRYANQENRFQIKNDAVLHDWALRFGSSAYQAIITTEDVVSGNTTIAGVGFYIYQKDGWTDNYNWPVMCFKNDNGDLNVSLISASGTFFLRGPQDNYLGGTRVNIERFIYHYIEMKVYHHQTDGTIEVRINGCPVISLTSVNTVHTANKATTRVCLGDIVPIGIQQYSRVDDFYVCDGSGNTNNDFLETVIVDTLWPDGDDTVNWTTTANSANHYENVNREQRDGSADYIEESGSGTLDLFTLDDSSLTLTPVRGVVAWAAAKYVTTNAGLQLVVESNGSYSNSSNVAITTDVLFNNFPPHVVETDPDTGNAWTNAAIDAMKSGVRTP